MTEEQAAAIAFDSSPDLLFFDAATDGMQGAHRLEREQPAATGISFATN
jgi:hypothetical protein